MSNTQTTINTLGSTYLNKDFYDKKLLETARTRLIFAKFGQKRSIPRNSGKRVEFRRYDLFSPELAASPLMEGVTPEGQSLSQSRVEAESPSMAHTWKFPMCLKPPPMTRWCPTVQSFWASSSARL